MKRGLVVVSLLMAGCFPLNDGRKPPIDKIYFPVGVALSQGGDRLYVANSDFDLQFNAGTVLVLDAKRIRELLPRACQGDADCNPGELCDVAGTATRAPSFWCENAAKPSLCGALGEKSAAEELLEPGPCANVDLTSPPDGGSDVLLDGVVISAFATDVMYRSNPNGGGRLFVPVRGDATLHWADVENEANGQVGPVFEDSEHQPRYIDCGQGSSNTCDANHRRGDERAERTADDRTLAIEPFAVTASEDGQAVITTHQSTGELALFVNDWCAPESGPELKSILSGLPLHPVGIATIPVPRAVPGFNVESCSDPEAGNTASTGYQPGFLVTFSASSQIQLVRYFNAQAAAPAPPSLEATAATTVSVVPGFDSRGIAIEASARKSCEASCPEPASGASNDCLVGCAGIPLGVYASHRTPAALLIGQTSPSLGTFASNDLPNLTEVEALRGGPSRVVVADVIDRDGTAKPRVFVVTFDTRFIYIYDPSTREIETRIHTGRGPHGFAVDSAHGLGYVGHFTDSYIGVVDLDRRHVTYGQIILTLGNPTPPRASE